MSSKIELSLNTGDVAIIEVEDDTSGLLLFLLGKTTEQPPHPDDEARRLADRLNHAMRSGEGLHVMNVHMVTAEEAADRTAAYYREMASRTLERMDLPPLAEDEGPR
jgi:septal ring factor EnvC (AmiA/AmiB activator)